MIHKITSTSNPLIRDIVKLQKKSSERNSSGLFVAEGRREAALAMMSGHRIDVMVICPALFVEDPAYPLLTLRDRQADLRITEVSVEVYNKLAYRSDAEGVIIVGKQNMRTLEGLKTSKNPLIIVLEAIEKPGNLGAILRTADAAGVDAVILADSYTDHYNPNAIRGSLGCVFSLPIVSCSSVEALQWLNKNGIRIFPAALQTTTAYYTADFSEPTALVFGAEDKGLSQFWRKPGMQLIKIPMAGRIDSLNVAASVAVLCYEAVRQRISA